MSEDEMPDSPPPCKSPEEKLLLSSRTGDVETTTQLLQLHKEGSISLDLNVKGEQKSNYGWTPLHLACYFGHEAICNLLIKHGADINIVNDTGDTPLHKAAYTGREELVLLLLSKNANVFIRNSEGESARDISEHDDIKKLLKGAEEADMMRKNNLLLHAAREGDTQVIENLLKDNHPPDINSVDSLGNSALHCSAYRGKKEVAVLLLQHGINTSIKNLRGQYASDLAVNLPMKQLLSVQPVKFIQKTVPRFEGLLLRKSRFFGWREVWTVLEKGVMSFFTSRADSTTGTRRKGYKYLDEAETILDEIDGAVFIIRFNNRTRQRFSVPSVGQQKVDRQKWINAITEHIEFSTHYTTQGFADSDLEDDIDVMPLGTMQDKLQTAQAHLHLFEKLVHTVKEAIAVLRNNASNGSVSASSIESFWENFPWEIYELVDSAQKVSTSLSHCLTVITQQEQVRILQLKQHQEQCRVLQDALHALAQEHHELEKSFISPFHSVPTSPHYPDTDCDEFFDAFEGDHVSSSPLDISSNSDTIVGSETSLFQSFASNSSIPTNMRDHLHSKWGRATLPVPMFSRNDFSVWSILKQCIGKDLSKITMPIVFNEPLSLLQRLSEKMEYANLLEKASDEDDPVKRLEYVAAFAVSAISSNWDRLGKSFNPLLGETYELMREDQGFRVVSEQVSHHPPVTAFHAESSHFTFFGAIHPRLKLWARSVEIIPEGTCTLRLLKHNEVYTWKNVNCCVHNIIVGKLWMEQCGTMEVRCQTNGLYAELNFKPAGWYSKDLNSVEGFILNRQKSKLKFLFGKWNSFIKSTDAERHADFVKLKDQKSSLAGSDPKIASSSRDSYNLLESKLHRKKSVSLEKFDDSGEHSQPARNEELQACLLWEADLRPEDSADYYNFTLFAMALNELKEEDVSFLPSTDSRLRPDVRKLEEGNVDEAAYEKNRLEEKQRETRKMRKKDKTEWRPLWFTPNPHPYANEETWTYTGGYWDRSFDHCPDIF